ncbi:MAG: site-2 protease family protein [Candidatus Brocadia sp. AMX2]|nr:MAG: site-2 protease family protein [Candidatus Brocadia sp. AMX2]MBC6933337.1 site-2 protease family protein [Candidatus Brocadia sp.]MBL1169689.1 site-2 protease family protein [Candidatus Brocadia sp. AMX1]NOG41632.1 site-2 protease family protein [Planctomycetota bacterium]NUO06578.1 site-2 protease family protein [Candidatus Brocadia sinica]
MSVNLNNLLISIPAILYALTIHEYFHGWTANKFGDPTARLQGRLTLNPLAHIDILGALCFVFAHFGWGKPVPVNPYNFRNPRRDNMIVSFAGPASNFVSAFLFGVIFQLLRNTPFIPMNVSAIFYNLLISGIIINLSLAFFNMIPLFPLDGSHILEGLLPYPMAQKYKEIERYSPFILLGLIILGNYAGIPILGIILGPPIQYFLRLFTGL